MHFQNDHIYHIYNQGNNRRKVFFERENYLFFLRKVKVYVLPYADILAWCLMPNHFHFMVRVKASQGLTTNAENSQPLTGTKAENSQGLITNTVEIQPLTSKGRTFNNSIGIMLRSYTRAINKQQGTSGSLFRQETKAQCINCPKGISPSWFVENGITVGKLHPDFDYPKVCFDYIHQNPVKAGLVESTTDWEFSSAMDYAGLRKGSLINKDVAVRYGLVDGIFI